jgi:hypothetical protein
MLNRTMTIVQTSTLKRFSLRTLFVLMTLCCLVIGAWSVYVNPYRLQSQSLTVVNRLQGTYVLTAIDGPAWHRWLVTTFLGEEAFTDVASVDLSGREVDDDALRSLAGLTHLEGLKLDYTKVTDAGLSTLRAMPKLKEVSLRYTSVGDRGAAIIAAEPELHTAFLTGTKITDKAVE